MHASKFTKFKFIVRDARVFRGIWFGFIYPHNPSLFFATPQIYVAADENKIYSPVLLWKILGDPGAVSRAGRKGATKVFKHRRKSPGYRLSPHHFQTVKRMLAPDWAQKMLCIIVPNQRTASPEFFSWVRTRRLLTRSRPVWLMYQRNARSQESFSLI